MFSLVQIWAAPVPRTCSAGPTRVQSEPTGRKDLDGVHTFTVWDRRHVMRARHKGEPGEDGSKEAWMGRMSSLAGGRPKPHGQVSRTSTVQREYFGG
jgi:hypothetical protein